MTKSYKECITNVKELDQYFERADFIDVKVYEGNRTLREFIAGMLSYYPWWVVGLYRVRQLLVALLGLVKHEAPEKLPNLQAGDVSFTPGESVTFFIVRRAKEEHYWISETPDDRHLQAFLGVVMEPVGNSINRYHVMTSVFFKHWSGPVYFNIIRPFHHLVVSRMARHGLRKR